MAQRMTGRLGYCLKYEMNEGGAGEHIYTSFIVDPPRQKQPLRLQSATVDFACCDATQGSNSISLDRKETLIACGVMYTYCDVD